jgi:hypothetical protein
MRATVCAVLLALLLGACATSTAAHHGDKAGAHKRSTGVIRIRTSLEGGPLNPRTDRVMLNRPMKNVRISVVRSDGRRWHGRTTRAGLRTFKLQPGRYVITSGWCGGRRIHIKVLPERVLPVRYACPVP